MKFISSLVPKLLCFRAAIFPVPWVTSQNHKWSTSPCLLLWESGILATVMLNDAHLIRQLLKRKNCYKLTKNCVHCKPYLSHYHSSMKQNDYVKMTFPENLSLQSFRFALSMETSNTGSQKPVDCLYVEIITENHKLETVKSLRHQWIKDVWLFNPISPNSDQHHFSPNDIHRLLRAKSMRINKMILKRKSLIFYQILSTNSLRKCMEISLENLYVDIGLKGLRRRSLSESPEECTTVNCHL